MKSLSGKDVSRAVERHGRTLARIAGSHHIYSKPGSIVRLSILVHSNRPLKIGLQRHLMTLAGLTDGDL